MSIISYNTELIFESEEDKLKISEILKMEMFCWNKCSATRFKLENNSIVTLHKNFYKKFREEYPLIPSGLVVSVERSVISCYKSLRQRKHLINKPPVKNNSNFRLNNTIFSFKNGVFSIVCIGPRVKCKPYLYPKLQKLLEKYPILDPFISEKNGKILIHINFKIPDSPVQNILSVGVDVGILRYAATSEGKIYQDKQLNSRKRKARYNKSKLKSAANTTKSNSAKRKLKKLRHKEANVNRNFAHHLSTKIIKDTKADTIVLENLKSIKVKKHKYQNKNRISQVPMYMLRQFLTYKALLAKKTVIQVCPSYTSQLDHRTNKCDGERRGRRYYSKTGIIYDADINAAINIALRSKLPVSQTERLTYGQAIVNSPIVGRPPDLQSPSRKI